jgi:hypothetical protein
MNMQPWFFKGLSLTAFNFVADKIRNPIALERTFSRWAFTGIGAGIMAALMFLRQFPRWPIHYIGFPIGNTWVLSFTWFSIMIAWLVKSIILKYWGVRGYRAMKPFFLGMILGQITAAGLWMVIDYITQTVGNYIPIGVP